MRKGMFFNNMDIPQLREASTFYSVSKSPLLRGKSQQLKLDKTMHLDKLKLRLTQYLGQKSLNQSFFHTKSQNIGEVKLKKVLDGRHLKAQRISRREGFKMGHAGDEKNRKKREQEKQEDMKKMYKKSFTIKEIHPEPKNRQTKQYLYPDPELGKNYGTYYQIVALQKNFDKSKYCWKNNQAPHLIQNQANNSFSLKNRYDSRINPQKWTMKGKKLQHKELMLTKQFDGGVIQPWNNPEQNLLEFHD